MRSSSPYPSFRFVILSLCFIYSLSLQAQQSEGCIFLQGDFVEIGIAPNGAFGTPADAPAGYHSRPTPLFNSLYNPVTSLYAARSNALGFVADYGKDGWTTGNPAYFGDYFMPGTVQEGFTIQVNGVKSNAWSNNYQTFGSTGYTGLLTGGNISYTATSTEKRGVWQGAVGDLVIRQTIALKNTKSYFTANVLLKNNGVDTLRNIYYMRTVDPDNEVSITSSFTTKNKIAYQLPNTYNKTLVTATGQSYPSSYLGLGTKDCQARCFILRTGLLADADLESIYVLHPNYMYADSSVNDVGIGLVFNIGNIPPGDSTTFSYAYILNEADLDEAFTETEPGFMYNGTFYPSGSVIVQPTGSVLPVSIVNGDYYNWTWSPANFLSTTTGTLVNATVSTDPVTYTISGIGTGTVASRCSNRSLNITISPYPISPPPSVSSPNVYYCVNQTASALSATGPGVIRWYTTATGGSPAFAAPTPSTTVAGIFIWYVSQEIDGVESIRIPVTVTVKPPPLISIAPIAPSVCLGDSVRLVATGTAATYEWSPAGSLFVANNDTVLAFPLINTTYTIAATDSANCKNTATVLVTVKALPSIAVSPADGAICKGDSIRLTASGSSISYNWNASASLNTTNGPVVIAKPLTTSTYAVTGTDANSCKNRTETTVTVNPLPEPSLGPDKGICIGSTAILSPGNFSSYSWHDGSGQSTFSANGIGTYWVKVEDGFGCKASDTINIVTIFSLPKDFLPGDMSFCRGNEIAVKVSGYNQYLWSDGSTNAKIIINKFGQYKLTVTDNNGCAGTDSITLFDAKCIPFIVPSAFTPNGDGLNDIFRPLITQLVKGYKMTIWNRWGGTVYETVNAQKGWDGNFGGIKQGSGVYVYLIQFTDADGASVQLNGTVTLIR